MSIPMISVEGLGKSYLIGRDDEPERHTTFREALSRGATRLAVALHRRVTSRSSPDAGRTEEFWALRGVDFEIAQGEVVGIIGRNGAGKSTLLKILSRITEPTTGRVAISGRVASLLEVGTGFHPELTGRENIYLNGAILGMERREIRRKFDEIVEFAEVERFLDTPVKRYSSGMYVRLAFAVAAHLEPEILIVDEVLAVGDAEFQKKCIGKMQNVAGHGRTVLFVSHNMAAVRALCGRAICLQKGQVAFDGETLDGVLAYSRQTVEDVRPRRVLDKEVCVIGVDQIGIDNGDSEHKRFASTSVYVEAKEARFVNMDVRITDIFGAPILYGTLGNETLTTPLHLHEGENRIEISFDVSGLVVGEYILSVDVSIPFVEWLDRAESVGRFSIETHHWGHVIQPPRQEWGVGCVQSKLVADVKN